MALTDSEIKEMVPPIGLAKTIIKLIPKLGMYWYTFYVTTWMYILLTGSDVVQFCFRVQLCYHQVAH